MKIKIQLEGEFKNLDEDRMCELIDIFVKKFYSPSLMDINELDEIMQITTRQFLVAEIEMPHLISKFLQEGSERPEGNRTEATVRIIIK